jgi:HEAT repeat protein
MPNVELPTTHEAIRELVSRQDAAALELLADVAASDDQFLRRTAVEVVGNHLQFRSLQSVILNALTDRSEYVVRTACDVVAKCKISEAHDLILSLLESISGSTRQTALRALSAIWRDADFSAAFRAYERDAEIRVRREAAWALRKHAVAENWRVLFEAFSEDELARHRQWACEIAKSFAGADETRQLLSKLTFDSNGHVRKAAARTIEMISTRQE